MRLLVSRKYKKDAYTIGKLYVNGQYFSDTLEDKDRGLTSTMSEAEIAKKKKYGETAIPTGTYELQMSYSPKFAARSWGKRYGGKVLEVLGVKGFTGVRVHPGNYASESLGCIFPGKNTQKGAVLQSVPTYYFLLDVYVMPAFRRGEKVTLTIE